MHARAGSCRCPDTIHVGRRPRAFSADLDQKSCLSWLPFLFIYLTLVVHALHNTYWLTDPFFHPQGHTLLLFLIFIETMTGAAVWKNNAMKWNELDMHIQSRPAKAPQKRNFHFSSCRYNWEETTSSLVEPQFLCGGTFESETSAFADYFVFTFLRNTIFENIAIWRRPCSLPLL